MHQLKAETFCEIECTLTADLAVTVIQDAPTNQSTLNRYISFEILGT